MTAIHTEMDITLPSVSNATFAASVSAVQPARALVAESLRMWGLDVHLHDARLTMSEIFTNAVQHGEAKIIHVWVVRLVRHIVIRVWDPSLKAPEKRNADDTAPTGRGLLIVEEYATGGWGVDWADDGTGKVVWARIER